MPHQLQWKKFHPFTDKNAFICLVDHMGNDSSIVQAARVSYGKDEQEEDHLLKVIKDKYPEATDTSGDCDSEGSVTIWKHSEVLYEGPNKWVQEVGKYINKTLTKDRQLIRYLMNHSHTTPFEMVEIKFMVQVPMDCWRQWIRHRTASVNEYSTRYTEALDFFQVTDPTEWRLQSAQNKQGSSGYLDAQFKESKEKLEDDLPFKTPGEYLSYKEQEFQESAEHLYKERLQFGIAKEQARKDLPLSTYTRAYWKCDLHNIFNFLRLRMDSHAQLEIRQFANCMFEIVKQLCPVACEAFEDYALHSQKFSRMEMEGLKDLLSEFVLERDLPYTKSQLTDREWKAFLAKLS